MSGIIAFFRAILFSWHYERGTWQYDVMCVAILAFIFLIPTSFFDERKPRRLATKTVQAASLGTFPKTTGHPVFVTADDLKQVPPAETLQKSLESVGLRAAGRPVTVKHFEVVTDGGKETKIVGYRVWFE